MKKITCFILAVISTLCCFAFTACGGSDSVKITFVQEGQKNVVVTCKKGETLKDVPTPVKSSDTTLITEWNITDDFVAEENITITTTEYTDGLEFTIDSYGSEKYYKVEWYRGTASTVVIPEYYRGVRVGIIKRECFRRFKNVTVGGISKELVIDRIVLPEGLVYIQTYAFAGTSTYINVPSTLKKVDSFAFADGNATGTKGVLTIPAALKSIAERAFFGAISDTIIIEEGITEVGSYGVGYCNATELVWPKSLNKVHGLSFVGSKFSRILYAGNAFEWEFIEIGDESENGRTFKKELESEKYGIYFYSEKQPSADGNYWHYDENGKPAVWTKQLNRLR